MGNSRRQPDHSDRSLADAAGIAAQPLDAPDGLAFRGRLEAHFPPSRPGRNWSGKSSRQLRLARQAPRGPRHQPAPEERMVGKSDLRNSELRSPLLGSTTNSVPIALAPYTLAWHGDSTPVFFCASNQGL